MLAVAHFRRILFKPTETFLYSSLTALRRVLPVGITFQIANAELFPFDRPLVELYRWSWHHRAWRWMKEQMPFGGPVLKYDVPRTFAALRRYDVRLLHAHFGYTGYEVLPVKRKIHLPLVVTFYGEDVSAMARTEEWRPRYEALFAEADLFLVEGPHMREDLLRIGCPEKKAAIQRIALHLQKYPFAPRNPKTRGERVRLLFCGSFREKKGLLYALEAVRLVRSRGGKIEFTVIGDGDMRPQVEDFVARHNMHDFVRLLGFQPHERMIQEMCAADIFIHPSVLAHNGDSEGGAPTTILEAQACGLPVVSTTHADIPNVVAPGKSALLAPERDPEALAAHLLTLLSEPERWAEMGRAGRALVEKYHDISIEISHLEKRYYELAGLSEKS